MIEYKCANCGEAMSSPDSLIGAAEKCPGCGSSVVVPSPHQGGEPTPAPPRTASPKQRVVRVFISSTFRDMHAEREELVKRIFPQLRKLCEDRGVTFAEVDLRWGIPDEQKAEGRVLPICLAEIERCRPYFIGLLGQRYGWVLEHIDDELVNQQRWLAEHRQRSVTELEILHGVLNNPEMANRACFYFRDPAYVESLPPQQREDFTAKDAEAAEKLERLKQRIRKSGLAVRENYPDPQTLSQWVLEDLTTAINQEFPIGTEPDPLDKEAAQHEAFAQSRAGVYIGRREYSDRLDQHAAGPGEPLVVLGESGCGKSALLANWTLQYREAHGDELVLMHFIGASPYSADWAAMLRRVMGELKRRFHIEQDIPDKPDELRATFVNWLHMAAARGRVVLILDALNQLEDRDQAPDLVWLPPVIPENVRLIVSTLPGRPLDHLQKRNWPTLTVEPLTIQERARLIQEYLGQYRKTLARAQSQRIAAAEQAANPLFLRALLEELRLFGRYEELDARIDHYLAAQSVPELFERILERYEGDYERDRPGLVRDAMTFIWAARRGLSEAELLDLLGSEGNPLPRAFWSPLYLAAEQSLVTRSRLITFGHAYLRAAVEHKYLPTEDAQGGAHLRLADYFDGRELDPRKVDELPWQLAHAGAWQQLCERLVDLRFLEAAWKSSEFDVKAYWAQIEDNSPLRVADVYEPALESPYSHGRHVEIVARLLGDKGQFEEALVLRHRLIDRHRVITDIESMYEVLLCCQNQALILIGQGRLDEALSLLDGMERSFGGLVMTDDDLRQQILHTRALALAERGDRDAALSMLQEQEQICREAGIKDGLMRSLGDQASIAYEQGDLARAMRLHQEGEQICRELGNRAALHIFLGNQATILMDLDDLNGALSLCKEQEGICREIGDKQGLQGNLGNQGQLHRRLGDEDTAMALFVQAETICREIGARYALSTWLINKAISLRSRNSLDEAMTTLKEAETIRREVGNEAGLRFCVLLQALIHADRFEAAEAMTVAAQQEEICRASDDLEGLAATLLFRAFLLAYRMDKPWESLAQMDEGFRLVQAHGLALRAECIASFGTLLETGLRRHASLLRDSGDIGGSITLLEACERICRELGYKADLATCLTDQAVAALAQGHEDHALALHRESERLFRHLGEKDGLQRSLGSQGSILMDGRDVDAAMALHREQEGLCRELGNDAALHVCLGNQAIILARQGNHRKATALFLEQERLCRELGNKNGLQTCLGNRAILLNTAGDLDGALALLSEQERVCRELGNNDALQRSQTNQAVILRHKGIALRNSGHCEDAILCFDKAVAIDPRDKHTWNNKAVALQVLGRLEEAVLCYERAIEIDPRDGAAWNNKGKSLADLGRLGEAIPCFDRAAEIDPRMADAWNNKGMALGNLGRLAEAIAYFDKALEFAPSFAPAWYNKALAADRLGRSPDAVSAYHQFIRLAPQEFAQLIPYAQQRLKEIQ